MHAVVRRGYTALGLGQLHWRRCGQGAPLLPLHQSPSSGAMWEPLLPLLAAGGRLALAPDLPGCGASDGGAAAPRIADYAQAMLGLADALGWGRFDLLGHHTGAAVALRMAADAPQRIGRLVLWGIPLLDDVLAQRLRAERPPRFADEGQEIAALWARRRQLAGADFSPALAVRWMTELLQCGFTLPWAHWAVVQEDMAALLRAVGQPALALCGPRDPVWPRAREAAGLLRQGRFEAIDGAGLDVADSHTRRLAELALAFLAPT